MSGEKDLAVAEVAQMMEGFLNEISPNAEVGEIADFDTGLDVIAQTELIGKLGKIQKALSDLVERHGVNALEGLQFTIREVIEKTGTEMLHEFLDDIKPRSALAGRNVSDVTPDDTPDKWRTARPESDAEIGSDEEDIVPGKF